MVPMQMGRRGNDHQVRLFRRHQGGDIRVAVHAVFFLCLGKPLLGQVHHAHKGELLRELGDLGYMQIPADAPQAHNGSLQDFHIGASIFVKRWFDYSKSEALCHQRSVTFTAPFFQSKSFIGKFSEVLLPLQYAFKEFSSRVYIMPNLITDFSIFNNIRNSFCNCNNSSFNNIYSIVK